jgi:hypothetical protein
MPSADPAVFNDLCTDTTGEFCAEDPDGSGGITGKAILEEDVRQLCIHELYTVKQIHTDTEANEHVVAYAGKFWDYVEKLGDACPGGTDKKANPKSVFGRECSEQLMKTVGNDVSKVQECQANTPKDKLRAERENKAWSPSAVRINGWRYKGVMDADLVTRALCQGFIVKPKECKDVLQRRDPFVKYTGAPQQRGMSLTTFVTLVSIGVCVMVCGLFLYRRMLKKHVERTIREEVTLEVNTHMASYSKMAAQF